MAMLLTLLAAPGAPATGPAPRCSLAEFRRPLTHADLVARTERLVDDATVVVRARAASAVAGPPADPDRPSPDYAGRLVTFDVLERIAGPDSLTTFVVAGELAAQDDFNPGTVPYVSVRSAGQRGNCFALDYRLGAEYLLLMRVHEGALTPYWWPLAPLNEQVRGPDDPWVRWVRDRVRERRR